MTLGTLFKGHLIRCAACDAELYYSTRIPIVVASPFRASHGAATCDLTETVGERTP